MQDIPKLIEDYNDRFKSGNSIPVERIVICGGNYVKYWNVQKLTSND